MHNKEKAKDSKEFVRCSQMSFCRISYSPYAEIHQNLNGDKLTVRVVGERNTQRSASFVPPARFVRLSRPAAQWSSGSIEAIRRASQWKSGSLKSASIISELRDARRDGGGEERGSAGLSFRGSDEPSPTQRTRGHSQTPSDAFLRSQKAYLHTDHNNNNAQSCCHFSTHPLWFSLRLLNIHQFNSSSFLNAVSLWCMLILNAFAL